MFVNGKLFQPSMMFAGKASAYPSEHSSVCPDLACKHYNRPERLASVKHSSLLGISFQILHSRVGPWPYPQTLDLAGKACQVITKIINYGSKSFSGLAPVVNYI